MGEYDTALKLLLQGAATSALRQLTNGLTITDWLEVELPQVQSRRADLLGATSDGTLLHIELQSSNDPAMPLRMAEYALAIYRKFGQLPTQIVLFVGASPLTMKNTLHGHGLQFQYTLADIRDLPSSDLLDSPRIEDNILSILTRLQNRAETIHQILDRITTLPEPERRAALAQLLILSGLRNLEREIEQEAERMPILNDILDHKVLGPAILKGRQQGLTEGRQEGRQDILKRQLQKRFGALPAWVEDRLAGFTAPELDEFAVRILDAASLEELF